MVKTIPTGGFTTDSGTWADIARRGKLLLDYCLFARRARDRRDWGGGVGDAGTHGRLNIVIYERNSPFDLAMTRGIDTGHLIMDGSRMANSSASSDPVGNLTVVQWNLTVDHIQLIFKDFIRGSMPE